MKPDPQTLSFPDESVVVENYLENYQLCHLIRDRSWPMQEPDIDPFTHQALDLDLSVFDANGNEPTENGATIGPTWNVKPEQIDINPGWQVAIRHNDTKLHESSNNSSSTGLTPVLAALDFPKALVADLDRDCHFLSKAQCFPCPALESVERHVPQLCHAHNGGDAQYNNESRYGSEFRSPKDKITIGIYTRAERDAKIYRFRQKRQRRNFTKRVLYGCRKRFADSRPRVGGRFVMNENRVIKPRTFLKRGRPRKVAVLSLNCLAASLLAS